MEQESIQVEGNLETSYLLEQVCTQHFDLDYFPLMPLSAGSLPGDSAFPSDGKLIPQGSRPPTRRGSATRPP
jgi:hypothetical protein